MLIRTPTPSHPTPNPQPITLINPNHLQYSKHKLKLNKLLKSKDNKQVAIHNIYAQIVEIKDAFDIESFQKD
jgi:hypothetical protein